MQRHAYPRSVETGEKSKIIHEVLNFVLFTWNRIGVYGSDIAPCELNDQKHLQCNRHTVGEMSIQSSSTWTKLVSLIPSAGFSRYNE